MLYYREHQWMLVPGRSRFMSDIDPEHRTPEDVEWRLEINFVAAGARWRRVKQQNRPSLELRVCFFQPDIRHWTALEHVSFWDPSQRGPGKSKAGWLTANYKPARGEHMVDSALFDHIWRVARREGRFFTVEMAAFADGRNFIKDMSGVAVMSTGEEEQFEPDEAFWRANAQLYMVENIPLGVVSVEVPRNAGDPEDYAVKRARSMLGLEDPEEVEMNDLSDDESEFQDYAGNLHVDLHYHGHYED